ncbi:hypothetical protein RKE38_01725 [Phycicoccus sp. M110.8]|uniref:hypothetical protein n=1 Tax=Phycicoccus sp. M110.8 TaxID=3075433 RepID=UPI0028FD912A|nr:hypothetical protein [Phycicoccus sp. M110.8]MDU0312390.1 hypothetical protein [Phycicoccus sp. M110.8]
MTMLVVALATAAASTTVTAGPAAAAADTAVGTYYSVTTNQRVLDTRTGLGAPKAPLGPRGEIALQLGGRAGIPTGNAASAVVLNLTGVTPTSSTYLTAYPSGSTRPGVSSLNLAPRAVRANLVTVPVGSDGKVRIYNNSGSVNVVADVMGYYAGSDISGTKGIGSMYAPLATPGRLFDSRDPDNGILVPGDSWILGYDFGAQNANVKAYAVNITAINGTGSGFVTAWDGTGARPNASNLNYVKGQVVPNMAVVPAVIDPGDGTPVFAIENGSSTASVHVVVDVVGIYLVNQTEGLRFAPIAPQRIVDTRNGLGDGVASPIGAAGTRTFTAGSPAALDATYAIVANATAIAPTRATYLTLFEADQARPPVSNLNVAAGEIAANAAFVSLGTANRFSVYNNSGSVNLALDVTGRFDLYQVPTAAAPLRSPSLDQAVEPGSATRVQR